MIFGGNRDFDLLVHINREITSDVVEQEVLYYKISLEETEANIYGESSEKVYKTPVKLNCLINRGDQVVEESEYGSDLFRQSTFAFVRQDLADVEVVPEVGDIIMWQEDYWEADTVVENQLFLGRDNKYNLEENGPNFGSSLSIVVECHLTRADRVGITQKRL